MVGACSHCHQIKEIGERTENGLFGMSVRTISVSKCSSPVPSCAKARRRRRAGVIFSPPCSSLSSSSLSLGVVLAARARMLLVAGMFWLDGRLLALCIRVVCFGVVMRMRSERGSVNEKSDAQEWATEQMVLPGKRPAETWRKGSIRAMNDNEW